MNLDDSRILDFQPIILNFKPITWEKMSNAFRDKNSVRHNWQCVWNTIGGYNNAPAFSAYSSNNKASFHTFVLDMLSFT